MAVNAEPVNEAVEEQQELARMRDYFAAQPKVTIKCLEDERVQINGYVFIIKGGERVDVPKDVADLLEQSGKI